MQYLHCTYEKRAPKMGKLHKRSQGTKKFIHIIKISSKSCWVFLYSTIV